MAGQVGFAPYALPGSQQLGANIAASFEKGCDSVILENHGVVVAGQALDQAFQRFEAFEFSAKTIIKANRLGHVHYLDDSELASANNRKQTYQPAELGRSTSQEKELRKQLIDFLKRGCRQRLFISTEGSYSARVDDDEFLITPSQMDRERLRASDLVRIKGDLHEAHRIPSRASRLHASIYRRHPEVQSIVFAHPVNATAFSITRQRLDARTIPESYVFLREVNRVPYGVQYSEEGKSSIADFVSLRQPASIVENDGVVVVGTSVLDVFDRLEVLESTAEAIINASCIGTLTTMGDSVIKELDQAFGLK
jgi:L-fuculose-phosphate aldolase